MSDLKKVLDKANAQLAQLESDNSPKGLGKKIAIHNAIADLLYSLADTAKAEGKDKVAWDLHDAANESWGKVVALSDDLENAPRDQTLKNFQSEHPDLHALMLAQLNKNSSDSD